MLSINLYICTFICAIVSTITNTILGQQSSFFIKPWPTYSLQNMPQTRFTCHDKILGGYYADPEAQCQMFHVCVKVAGVGVQDFRFLCPNGTAFDQEAQICADWGDVDCEQSVLYYGSDNFDLYRLGSGFESKRAPLAEEDESTFHLQRAESGDVRRFKETRIDQKSRPDQPPNYTKHFETVTRGTFNTNANNYHSNNNNNNNNNNVNAQHQQNVKTKKQKLHQAEVTKKPIVSYYTPTSTTTTTEHNYNDDSKQDLDDIFKGSHSSNFFSNRNGGREDDLDHPVRPSLKPNDFSDFSKKSEASTIGKSRVTPTRPKRPSQITTKLDGTTTPSTTIAKAAKKVTQHSFYNTDFYDYAQYKSTTSSSQSSVSTHVTTPRPVQGQSNANRFNIGFNDYQTQAKIQPTTYNPNRYKPNTTKYTEFKREKTDQTSYSKPSSSINKKTQKFEQTQTKINPQNSTFAKLNEFDEFSKIKPQPPQPFQPQPPAKTFEAPAKTSLEPHYYRSRGQPQARVYNQQPEPFRASQRKPSKTIENIKEKHLVTVKAESKPRGFASRGSINYKATTQRDTETHPTTTSNSHKKFSTLVPKDKYSPTTFKPSTYKKHYDNNLYQSQQTVRPANSAQKSQTSTTTTTIYTTANPYYNPDEDDGQYHPELYEIDYSRSNFNRQRQTSSPTTTTTSTTTTQKPFKQNYQNPVNHLKSQQQTSYLKEQVAAADFSDEDELFKTAQSLNFGAASINKLRADIFKAEKTSQQYNSQYNPHNSVTSPKATTTLAPPITTTTSIFTYLPHSTATQTTARPTTYAAPFSTTTTSTTTTTTTKRPTTTATSTTTKHTTAYPYSVTKSGSKHATHKKSKKNENKNKKKTSKRPPHADEDTSYDYAYYDSDTLSETPQEYPEYEIQEFTKTKRN